MRSARPVCRAQSDDGPGARTSPEAPGGDQAEILGVSRSGHYCRPRPVSDADLALMHRIDALHLEHPFAGSRMLRDMLQEDG